VTGEAAAASICGIITRSRKTYGGTNLIIQGPPPQPPPPKPPVGNLPTGSNSIGGYSVQSYTSTTGSACTCRITYTCQYGMGYDEVSMPSNCYPADRLGLRQSEMVQGQTRSPNGV
jgi:hypothetical protein